MTFQIVRRQLAKLGACLLVLLGLPVHANAVVVPIPVCGFAVVGGAMSCSVTGGLAGIADINPHLMFNLPIYEDFPRLHHGNNPCMTLTGPSVYRTFYCTDAVMDAHELVSGLLAGGEYTLQVPSGWYGEVTITTEADYVGCLVQAFGFSPVPQTMYTGGTIVYGGTAHCGAGANITSFEVTLDDGNPCFDLLQPLQGTSRLTFPCPNYLASPGTHLVQAAVCWISGAPGCEESTFPVVVLGV